MKKYVLFSYTRPTQGNYRVHNLFLYFNSTENIDYVKIISTDILIIFNDLFM